MTRRDARSIFRAVLPILMGVLSIISLILAP